MNDDRSLSKKMIGWTTSLTSPKRCSGMLRSKPSALAGSAHAIRPICVMTAVGQTVLARMFRGPSSSAHPLVKASTAAFEPEYTVWSANADKPASDDRLTIEPPFLIFGNTICVTLNTALALMSITLNEWKKWKKLVSINPRSNVLVHSQIVFSFSVFQEWLHNGDSSIVDQSIDFDSFQKFGEFYACCFPVFQIESHDFDGWAFFLQCFQRFDFQWDGVDGGAQFIQTSSQFSAETLSIKENQKSKPSSSFVWKIWQIFLLRLEYANGKLPSPAPVTTIVFPSNSRAIFIAASFVVFSRNRSLKMKLSENGCLYL